MRNIFSTLFLGLLLSACNTSVDVGGKKVASGSVGGGNTSNYTYDFTENNCPSGSKSFSSLDAMCAALKDDSQNNFCARNLRYEYFKANCPGRSWQN